MTGQISPVSEGALSVLIKQYALDLRRNASGGDDYPYDFAKGVADYLGILIKRAKSDCACAQAGFPDSCDNCDSFRFAQTAQQPVGLYRGFEVRCPHCESWFEPEDFEETKPAEPPAVSDTSTRCICDTDHPLFKERGHHPHCPVSSTDRGCMEATAAQRSKQVDPAELWERYLDEIRADRRALVRVTVSLGAAISILERTPAAKQTVASDEMFEIMLSDYRKAWAIGRAAANTPAVCEGK